MTNRHFHQPGWRSRDAYTRAHPWTNTLTLSTSKCSRRIPAEIHLAIRHRFQSREGLRNRIGTIFLLPTYVLKMALLHCPNRVPRNVIFPTVSLKNVLLIDIPSYGKGSIHFSFKGKRFMPSERNQSIYALFFLKKIIWVFIVEIISRDLKTAKRLC